MRHVFFKRSRTMFSQWLFSSLLKNLRPGTASAGAERRRCRNVPRRRTTCPLYVEALEERCLLSYTITDLGTLGGAASLGYAINNAGQVVGPALPPGSSHYHAFLYSGGSMTDL